MNPHKCTTFVKDGAGIERCDICTEAKTAAGATKEQAHKTAALAALALSVTTRELRDAYAEAREAHLPALATALDAAIKDVARITLQISGLVR